MRVVSAAEVDDCLDFPSLIDALAAAFAAGAHATPRHHHTIGNSDAADQTLLLMPAWNDRHIAVKLVAVTPDNGQRSLPAVMASVLLMDKETGETVAMIDGSRLTLWRTAAASALAARYLAPSDARKLLAIGSGALAPFLVRAHAAVRDISYVTVWNRTYESAQRMAEALTKDGFAANAIAADGLDDAVASADIVTAATLSTDPLVHGKHLSAGTHVDLVGAFTPGMRESDDACIERATLFVDTYAGALHEGGDLIQPIKAGLIERSHIKAELAELVTGVHAGRRSEDEITLFKSTGASLEDLAAAALVAERLGL